MTGSGQPAALRPSLRSIPDLLSFRLMSKMAQSRKALSLMGSAAAFGLAAASTALTVSDAAAQTAGMDRRQERQDDTSDERNGARGAQNGVRSGAPVQLPEQLSNSTGSANTRRTRCEAIERSGGRRRLIFWKPGNQQRTFVSNCFRDPAAGSTGNAYGGRHANRQRASQNLIFKSRRSHDPNRSLLHSNRPGPRI
jgi:hypothetical protein